MKYYAACTHGAGTAVMSSMRTWHGAHATDMFFLRVAIGTAEYSLLSDMNLAKILSDKNKKIK